MLLAHTVIREGCDGREEGGGREGEGEREREREKIFKVFVRSIIHVATCKQRSPLHLIVLVLVQCTYSINNIDTHTCT